MNRDPEWNIVDGGRESVEGSYLDLRVGPTAESYYGERALRSVLLKERVGNTTWLLVGLQSAPSWPRVLLSLHRCDYSVQPQKDAPSKITAVLVHTNLALICLIHKTLFSMNKKWISEINLNLIFHFFKISSQTLCGD